MAVSTASMPLIPLHDILEYLKTTANPYELPPDIRRTPAYEFIRRTTSSVTLRA